MSAPINSVVTDGQSDQSGLGISQLVHSILFDWVVIEELYVQECEHEMNCISS